MPFESKDIIATIGYIYNCRLNYFFYSTISNTSSSSSDYSCFIIFYSVFSNVRRDSKNTPDKHNLIGFISTLAFKELKLKKATMDRNELLLFYWK